MRERFVARVLEMLVPGNAFTVASLVERSGFGAKIVQEALDRLETTGHIVRSGDSYLLAAGDP